MRTVFILNVLKVEAVIAIHGFSINIFESLQTTDKKGGLLFLDKFKHSIVVLVIFLS